MTCTKPSATRQEAARAIAKHLRKSEAFARLLCAALTEHEAEQAASELDKPAAAVALAGLIYRALKRQDLHELAESLACEDFAVICQDVPVKSPEEMAPARQRAPGIRVIDSSELPRVP
jgi:folylpolyglutamate synthase/dihydropteroate synthase